MANQSDDVIGNFWGLVSGILGDIIPPNQNAKTLHPFALAPTADGTKAEVKQVQTFVSANGYDAVERAQRAAEIARAAAAEAAAERAAAEARAEAEAEAAKAKVPAQKKRFRFAIPEATYAEEAARVEAEARARAGAEAAAEAKAKAEAGVQAMQAIRAAATARAEAAATARVEATARAAATARAVGENEARKKVRPSSQPLADPPKADLSYYNLAKLMAPGAITLACGMCLAVGASSVATFGAVPLAIGIAIGVGSIAYYSRTRKNSSEVESKPKEAESETDIKIKKLEGLFNKNGDFKEKYFKKDGKFVDNFEKVNELDKILNNSGKTILYSKLDKNLVNKLKKNAQEKLKQLKVEKIKKLYRENPIETLEGLFQKNGRFKKEYEENSVSFNSGIKKAELEAILREIDPYSYSDPFKEVDGENKTDSKKIDYSRLNLIAQEKLHRLKADKVINSFVDSDGVVFEKADLTILDSSLNRLEKRGDLNRVIDASIKILEASKSKHDKTKTFGQDLINFDKTIDELDQIKKSYSSKRYLYPSLPLENDPFKGEKEKEREKSEKKQEEITDFGRSSSGCNRSKVDDLKEKIEELKKTEGFQFPYSKNYINKQIEVNEMAEKLIKRSGSNTFSFSSTIGKKIDYSEKLKKCLGIDDASFVRKVGKDLYDQTVIDEKSIFDREEEKKMAIKPTTATRPRPGTGKKMARSPKFNATSPFLN